MEAFLLAHARTGACPPVDLLFAVEEDVLPAASGAPIRDHIASCKLCQTILTELDPAYEAFSPAANARIRAQIEARSTSFSHRSSNSARRNLLAIAAVLIVGIVSFFSYRLLHPSASEQPATATNHAPAAPVAIAELHNIAPLSPPGDVPALVTRGASTVHGPSVNDLMPAFRAYNRGNFAQAAADFAPLAGRFPTSEIPPLFLGVSQLELNQNAVAQHSLQQAYNLAGPSHHDDAAWYLALADLRLSEPAAAVPLLHQLCSQPRDPYALRACALAHEIHPS
jgi:hypothetical protein